MTDIASTITKVFLASLGISLVIKYGVPYLTLPNSGQLALGLVLLPTVVMAIALGWDAVRSSSPESTQPPDD
jgi:hypothetical protein